jgi:hypothetical protein
MKPTNPIIIDGETYDLYTLNLAVTSKYLGNGSEDANIAMRLVPTRIDNGQVIIADAEARGLSIGTLEGADEVTTQTALSIQAALQTFIDAKGL